MLLKTIAGLVAVTLIAAAVALVATSIAPTTASADHYAAVASGKPQLLKGGISKNCLENQGGCASVVW